MYKRQELELDHKAIFILVDTISDYDEVTKDLEEKSVVAYMLTHPSNVLATGLGQIEEIEIEQL